MLPALMLTLLRLPLRLRLRLLQQLRHPRRLRRRRWLQPLKVVESLCLVHDRVALGAEEHIVGGG
jgi:hypothetical protein